VRNKLAAALDLGSKLLKADDLIVWIVVAFRRRIVLDGGHVITVTPHMILRPYRTAAGGAGGDDTPTDVAVMLERAG
jgi:hypothetical protein